MSISHASALFAAVFSGGIKPSLS